MDCLDPYGSPVGQSAGYIGLTCPKGGGLSGNGGLSTLGFTACLLPETSVAPTKATGKPQQCSDSTPFPVSIGTGNKWLSEQDYSSSGSPRIVFGRFYNSLTVMQGALGMQWRNTFDRSLLVSNPQPLTVLGSLRPDGRTLTFQWNGSAWLSDADIPDKLTQLIDSTGATTGWQYTTSDDSVEAYDATGKLHSIKNRVGLTQTLTYSDGTNGSASGNGGYVLDASGNTTTTALPAGLMIRVTDASNRMLSFGYDSSSRIVKMTDPAGGIYLYAYDPNNNLSSVTYPDGKTKTYLYGEAAYTSGAVLPHALTGILDENGIRYATYRYDATGRAYDEDHGGSVDHYNLAYSTDTTGNPVSTVVTDPLGTARTYNFTTVLGVVKSTGTNQPGGSGCGAASSGITYDANGNVASRTDFNGNKTTYIYDLTRNLETSRTEASGTPLARTITTTWHPTFRLPTQITEPGRVTNLAYDATTGNLLTKSITDTVSGTSRTWTYTYTTTADGTLLALLKSVDGPRTDVADVTSYSYSPNGDLKSVTNALGQVTNITGYDPNGRILTLVDPNSVTTTLSYWPRGWLKSKTVGSKTTSYDYDFVGQLKRITLADGSHLDYTYDNAHRLTDISDAKLNRVHYTLDNIGNRIKEEVFDSNNVLSTMKARDFDALNRLWHDIAYFNDPYTATPAKTLYTYDANGNLSSVTGAANSATDSTNRTTLFTYDALNRLTQVIDPINTALHPTQYGYDPLDQLSRVTDPRALTTAYTVNALGEATQQISPDSGTTGRTFDTAGNLKTATDARGIPATFQYDALNRLTAVTYPTTGENISYTWDTGTGCTYGVGRLCQVTDAAGNSSFAYDDQGNRIQLTRVEAGVSLTTQYGYDGGNRLSSEITPTGETVILGRDLAGHITNLTTTNGASTTTLVKNIAYNGIGQVTAQTLGNGVQQAASFDLSGQSSAQSFNQVDGDLNGDGVVDVADVALAERIALGLIVPTATQLAHGDVAPAGAPDGVIDAADVARILRKALGLETF